jgi:hypothetical protein
LDDEENVKMEEELQIIDRDNAKLDFKQVFWYWTNYNVDWQSIYGNKILDEPDLICDLMGIDIGVLHKKLEMDGKCRLLLVMASCCSKGQLGALNAKGYAERCNSAGKLVLTKWNSYQMFAF